MQNRLRQIRKKNATDLSIGTAYLLNFHRVDPFGALPNIQNYRWNPTNKVKLNKLF